MTYCLGIKVKSGLVALADTRITSGTETTTAKKISLYQSTHGQIFLMTSGLRSIRDKAVTYFEEVIHTKGDEFNKMYKVVNAFGAQLRIVSQEDKKSLTETGLAFNLFTIVGGRLKDDNEQKLYLLYPEGNWIEITEASPFTIIGNSGYGKPILNRTLEYESTLRFALKTGFLSFDSTRVSSNDVDFPIDIVIYNEVTGEMIEKRFEEEELNEISDVWNSKLEEVIKDIPEDWIDSINVLSKTDSSELLINHDQ